MAGWLVGAAGVAQNGRTDNRIGATRVGGRADVAGRAVGAGLEMAGQVMVRERHRGKREDVRRYDDAQDGREAPPRT